MRTGEHQSPKLTKRLSLQLKGITWFDKLLAQNPCWVRGGITQTKLIQQCNSSQAASFTGTVGFSAPSGVKAALPIDDVFLTFPRGGAIPRDAPHPKGAKLLHSWMLSFGYQQTVVQQYGWSVRKDVPPPIGRPSLMNLSTSPTDFARWTTDRPTVERTRYWFEDRIGPPQGPSPLLGNTCCHNARQQCCEDAKGDCQ